MTGTVVLPAPRRSPRTWDDVLDWTGSVRAVAVLRIAVGLLTLLHLRPFLRDAADGISYTDHFWQPFVAWLPELPDRLWFALIWIILNAAIPLLPLFGGAGVSIAWQAHLGGFFAGLLLVPLFERRPQ